MTVFSTLLGVGQGATLCVFMVMGWRRMTHTHYSHLPGTVDEAKLSVDLLT